MAFIAGKGFAILNSKAEKGDQKAKDLLAKLDKIDQEEADRLFSEILGKGGGGKGKSTEKKIKAPGASATDGQGKITEGAEEQPPSGKATPKKAGEEPVDAPKEPTGEVKPKSKRELREMVDGVTKKLSDLESSGRKITDKGLEKLAQKYGTDVDSIMDIAVQNDIDLESIYRETRTPTGKVTPKETITTVTKPVKNKTPLEKPVGQVEEKYGNQVPRGFTLQFDEDENREYLSNDETGDQYQIEVTADGKVSIPELGISASSIDKLTQGFNQPGDFLKEAAPGFGAAQERREKQGQPASFEVADPNNLTPDEFDRMDFEAGEAADPLSEANLKDTFDKYMGNVDMVLNDLRKQNIEIDNSDLEGVVEAFAQGYEYDPQEATDKIRKGLGDYIKSEIKSGNNPTVQEIADGWGLELDEVQDVYNEVTGQNPGQEPIERIGDLAPWEEENIKNILQKTGGDKAKTLEVLKQQQAAYEGPTLKEKYLTGIIDQAAAGETNITLPAEEPTAEQLAEVEPLVAEGDQRQQARAAIDDLMEDGMGKLQPEEVGELAARYGLTVNDILDIEQESLSEQDQDTGDSMSLFGENPSDPKGEGVKQQARQRIDDIMQEGRGQVSQEEAEALSEEFGLTVDEVRQLERQSQSETPFPDVQGTPLADTAQERADFILQDNQGIITTKQIQEIADEFGLSFVDARQIVRTQLANQEYKMADDPVEPEQEEPELLDFPFSPDQPEDDDDETVDENDEGEFDDEAFSTVDERNGGQSFIRLRNRIDFDPRIVTQEQINEIVDELGLKYKTSDEIRQIRNGVVKQWDRTPNRRGDDKSRAAMSAITAAIDQYDPNDEGATRTITGAQQLAGQGVEVPQTQPQQPQQQTAAAKPDRQKVEKAAADLGVDANLLEGLLELLKKVR